MNVTVHGMAVEVTLSRSNILDLLAILDDGVKMGGLRRSTESGLMLSITPQENEVHYKDRPNPQGRGYKHGRQEPIKTLSREEVKAKHSRNLSLLSGNGGRKKVTRRRSS